MEEHNLQVRDTTDDRIRQRLAIRQLKLQGLLFSPRDQELILVPRTPTSERTDESDEPNITQDHQSSIGRC